jgi:hypothetical protein
MKAKGIRFHSGGSMGKEQRRLRRLPRKAPSGDEVIGPDRDLIPDDGVTHPSAHPHRPWLVPGAGRL